MADEPKEEPKVEPKTFSEEYVKELREEAKNNRLKTKELEEKLKAIEDDKLAKSGELQKLVDQYKQEVNDWKSKYEEVEPYKEQLTKYQENDKAKMLGEIEDDELKKDLEGKSYEDIRLAHNVYIKTKPKKSGVDTGRTGISFYDDKKTWDDYSSSELDKLSKEHPDIYKSLKKKKYPNL